MRAPDGRVRLAYADFAGLLDGLSIESLVTKQIAAEELFDMSLLKEIYAANPDLIKA